MPAAARRVDSPIALACWSPRWRQPDEGDVPDPAQRRHRSHDGVLRHRSACDRHRDDQAARFQDPARDPRTQEPPRGRGALRLRRPIRGRIQGITSPGPALHHPADCAAIRQDVAVRRHRRPRGDRQPRDHVGADPDGGRLHRRRHHRGGDDDHRQLPAAGALRLPRHAGCRIRRLASLREVVLVQQRRSAHPDPRSSRSWSRHGTSLPSWRPRSRLLRLSSCASSSTHSSCTRPASRASSPRARASSSRSSTPRPCRRASSRAV